MGRRKSLWDVGKLMVDTIVGDERVKKRFGEWIWSEKEGTERKATIGD